MSNVDGWDDDDDLLDDECDQGTGWDDDIDLDLSEKSQQQVQAHIAVAPEATEANTTISHPSSTQQHTSRSDPAHDDGWGEDEDLFFDEENNEEEDHLFSKATPQTTTSVSPPVTKEEENEWGNDSGDIVFEDGGSSEEKMSQNMPAGTAETVAAAAAQDPSDGWGDEDYFDEDSETNHEVPPVHNSLSVAPSDPLVLELSHYIDSLDSHLPSIQAVLSAEYSTYEKAVELHQYYSDRPQLVDYTVTKELPRMDYTVVLENGDILTDKADVAAYLTATSSSLSILARCANQSLLADILQVLTGPDRLVRPQYLATAIATNCAFQIDVHGGRVQVVATLELSLPTTSAPRWTVADLRVLVMFSVGGTSNPPAVEFRLLDIVVRRLNNDENTQNLCNCAAFLQEMGDSMMFQPEQTVGAAMAASSAPNFRDVFLQSRWGEAMAGMQSALWKDLNAATGLGNKLRQMDTILAEAETVQQQAAQQQHQEKQQQQRPKSILGGLVRTLAQSVALPEEEEYHPQVGQQLPSSTVPTLYRRDEEGVSSTTSGETSSAFPKLYREPQETEAPVLYRRDGGPPNADTGHMKQQGAFPKLYNNTERDGKISTTTEQVFPKLYNRNAAEAEAPATAPSQQKGRDDAELDPSDGWGDEDDEVLSTCLEQADQKETHQQTENHKPECVEQDEKKFIYDPATDIIPTRKRWVHPTPNARRSLLANG